MTNPLHLLLLEDRLSDAELILAELRAAGFEPDYVRAGTELEYLAALDPSLDLILADYHLPQFDGVRALKLMQERGLDIPFILVSGTVGEDIAVEAMKNGAADYMLKDLLARLGQAVERALARGKFQHEKKRAGAELKTLNLKNQEALSISRMGYWEFDLATQEFTFNDQYYVLHGTTVEEAGGYRMSLEKFTSKYMHPDDAPLLGEAMRKVMESDDVNLQLQREARILRADGETRNVLVWFRIEKDDRGRTTKLLGVNQDITERKLAEEALKKSESEYRRLFDNANDVIIIFEPEDEIILEVNAAACAAYGYDHDELVGMSLKKLSRDVAQGEEHVQEFLAGNPLNNFESVHINKDGAERHFLINCSLIEYHNRKAILSINRDITERKQAEQEIDRLAKFPSENPNPVLRLSREGIVTYANAASDALLREWGCALGGFVPQFWRDLAAQTLVSRENKTVDIEFDGKVYSMFITPVAEAGYVNIYGRDTTERKRAEDELRESKAIVEAIVENIPFMLFLKEATDLRFVLFNRAGEELLGYTRKALLGRNDLDFYPPEQAAQFMAKDREVLERETGILDIPEEPILTAKKGQRLLHTQKISIRGADGTTKYLLGISEDITERKQAEDNVKTQLERLTALRQIDRAIISTSNVQLSLGILLSQTLSLLRIDACDILIVNPVMNFLEYAAGLGFRTKIIENSQVRIGEGLAGRAALTRETVRVDDLGNAHLHPYFIPLVREEGFVEYVGIPLIAKGKVVGVLESFQRSASSRDPGWLDFLESLAGQASIAIDNAQSFEGMQRSNMELAMAYDATIEGWSRAMDLRDKETEGHTQRVTELTLKLAERIGLSAEAQVQIRRGALLHDIGKLGVPDSILLKPGSLTPEEWEIMKRHPVHARDMLSTIVYLRPAMDIPYCHHEKWDGAGYPQGLAGEQIPLAARVFSVVDVWDALTSDRPYRPAWSREKAIEYLREQSGTHFDPRVVDAFLEMMEFGGID